MNNETKIGFYFPGTTKEKTVRLNTINNTIKLLKQANNLSGTILDKYLPGYDVIINQVNDEQSYNQKYIDILNKYSNEGCAIINPIKGFQESVDKLITYEKLRDENIPTPHTFKLEDFIMNDYPYYVKPRHGTMGEHVSLIKNKEELMKLLSNQSLPEMIIQPAFNDIECWRIVSTADKPILMYVKEGTGIKSIAGGSKRVYKDAPNEVINLAKRTVKVMGVDIAGVDILVNEDGEATVLELNPNFGYEDDNELVSNKIANAFRELIIERINKTN